MGMQEHIERLKAMKTASDATRAQENAVNNAAAVLSGQMRDEALTRWRAFEAVLDEQVRHVNEARDLGVEMEVVKGKPTMGLGDVYQVKAKKLPAAGYASRTFYIDHDWAIMYLNDRPAVGRFEPGPMPGTFTNGSADSVAEVISKMIEPFFK